MGGRAFPHLFCPRIRRELYLKTRDRTCDALTKIFTHVTVPDELPSKNDFGDVDFLVAGPRDVQSPLEFPWAMIVTRIKNELGTTHGRRGFFNEDCMYFAIPAPGREDEFFVQIDVKVCIEPELFSWTEFQLKFASVGKMVGSMVKPLGLTINLEGLWIRLEEMEDVNSTGSMVFLTKDARDVLKIIGLDRKLLDDGFLSNEELYAYLASSWVFNPAHFAERLKDTKYLEHLRERSKAWVYFVTKWMPMHYPKYQFPSRIDNDVGHWYNIMRIIMRESAFTMYPRAAENYYEKRRIHLREMEEKRLRKLILSIIPIGNEGWTHDLPQPPIIWRSSELQNANVKKPTPNNGNVLFQTQSTSIPGSRTSEPESLASTISSSTTFVSSSEPFEANLLLDALPRPVPHGQEHVSRPPPADMSREAKLLCLARWTLFNPDNGTLHLANAPREKKFEMCWIDSGATDNTLAKWAKEMWWVIWDRQHRVNWNGMWRHKMAKEDKMAGKEVADRVATAHSLLGTKPEGNQRFEASQESQCLVRTKCLEQYCTESGAIAGFSQHETEMTETVYDDKYSAESYVKSDSEEDLYPRRPRPWKGKQGQCTNRVEEELTDREGSQERRLKHTSITSGFRSIGNASSHCRNEHEEVKSISIRDLKRKADSLHSGRARSRRKFEDVNKKLGVLIFE